MATEQELLKKITGELFIDGRWRAASGGESFAVLDPATGEVLKEVASASVADGIEAIEAADAAFREWSTTSPRGWVRLQLRSMVVQQIRSALLR